MKFTSEALLMHPLFYDLLSGELEPIAGSIGSSHTLAKLAVATYFEGDHDNFEHPENDLIPVVHSPSWAPNLETSVLLKTESQNRNNLVSVSLGLKDDYDLLHIFIGYGYGDAVKEGLNAYIHSIVTDEEIETPLETGSQMDAMKIKVSRLADSIIQHTLRT